MSKPAKIKTDLVANDTVPELMCSILAVQSQKMQAQYKGVLAGKDPEAVHDARVATRRMRSAVHFFQPWLPLKSTERLRRQLRQAGRALGPVRDFDVSIINVRRYAAELSPVAEAPLLRHLESQRQESRQAMFTFFKGKGYDDLTESLAGYLDSDMPSDDHLQDVLPGLLNRAAANVQLFEDTLHPRPPVPHLHALRISIKYYRYLLEFTRPLTSPTSEPLIAALVAMQDQLGDLHDADVGCDLAYSLLRDPKIELSKKERKALIVYGTGLTRHRNALAASFIDTASPTSPWGIWLKSGVQDKLGALIELLEKG